MNTERIAVVDVLRAFALLGIIVTHAEMGFLAGLPPAPDFMLSSPLDRIVHGAVAVLVESKFFSIFAFLFGLSFAIQIDRADQKGAAFAGRFGDTSVIASTLLLSRKETTPLRRNQLPCLSTPNVVRSSSSERAWQALRTRGLSCRSGSSSGHR